MNQWSYWGGISRGGGKVSNLAGDQVQAGHTNAIQGTPGLPCKWKKKTWEREKTSLKIYLSVNDDGTLPEIWSWGLKLSLYLHSNSKQKSSSETLWKFNWAGTSEKQVNEDGRRRIFSVAWLTTKTTQVSHANHSLPAQWGYLGNQRSNAPLRAIQ